MFDKSIKKLQKVGFHTHIVGLGDNTEHNKSGLVGQTVARKALLFLKNNLNKTKIGQLVVLKGPRGSGKTALLQALAKDCADDTLVNYINACEVYSHKVSKIEFLVQQMRMSINIKITENVRIIEGEVVLLNKNNITLKTLDMESTFDIGEKMYKEIEDEKITVGDIIRIIKERGKVFKIGRNISKKEPEFISDVSYINCPEGEMFKTIEEIQSVSLHDMDTLNNKTQTYVDLFDGETGEIIRDVRADVDKCVKNWILESKAQLCRGLLIIEDAHLLDKDCLGIISTMLESSISPTVVMTVMDEHYENFSQLLKSGLLISLSSIDSLGIINNKIKEYKLTLDDDVLEHVFKMCQTYGLRYVMNILAILSVKTDSGCANKIATGDITALTGMFLDSSRAFQNY